MERMWIELLQDVGDKKKGDQIEVTRDVGQAYITAGLAKDAGTGPENTLLEGMRAEISAALQEQSTAIATLIRESTTAALRRPSVIEPGLSEADKREQAKGAMAEIMASVYFASNPHVDDERREKARDMLTKKYKCVRAASESGGATTGGYLVQPEYYQSLYMLAAESQVIVPRCRRIPMGSKELNWPALDQYKTPSKGQSAIYGGVQVYRKTESVQRTESDPVESSIQFVAEDMIGYHEVSRDLLADSIISYDALIREVFGMAFAWREDWECFQGIGGAQFQGIFNAKASKLVNRNTGNQILFADVVGMQANLMPQAWDTAIWVSNVTTYPQIAALKDAAGNAIFFSSAMAGITQRPIMTLNGRPLLITEKVPALGTTGDLCLIDPDKYAIGERSGMEVALSEHFKFDTDQVAFRFKKRNSGKPLMKKPYTQADGSNTQVSPFVILN